MDSFHPCVSAGKRRTPLPDLRCAECSFLLERVMGIEPTPTAWKAVVLAVILHPRVSAIRYYHMNGLFVKKFLCLQRRFGNFFPPRSMDAKRSPFLSGQGCAVFFALLPRPQRGTSRSSCRRQPSRMSRYAVSKSPVYQGSSISRSSSSGRSLPAGSPPVMRRILRRFQASI